MGDRLLDLSSFEIDEGSAKITSVSIGGSVTPISYFSTDPWAQDGWKDYFYINKNVLKLLNIPIMIMILMNINCFWDHPYMAVIGNFMI